MHLEVTREAARRIRRRTGEIYIWLAPVGSAWVSDELAFSRPHGVDFRKYQDAGIEVFVAPDLRARNLRIEAPWLPWRAAGA